MAVEIGNFTKIPNKFFGSGKAAQIGPSASLLFVALCEQANRVGENTFRASDKALAADTGLSPRTICNARKALLEERLLACTRDKGSSYRYTLPVFAFSWVAIKDRPRTKRKVRALHSLRKLSSANFASPDILQTPRTPANFANVSGRIC